MFYRDAVLFKRGALSALVLALLFFCLCTAAALSYSSAVGRQSGIRLLVADEDGSALSRIAVNTVSAQEYMASALQIETCDREEALRELRAGRAAAVLVLPEGYLGDILRGADCTAQLYLSRSAALHADMAERIAAAGEKLIEAGQYGVFAGQALLTDAQEETAAHYLESANAALISEAVGAYAGYFDVTVLDYGGTGMDAAAHYVLCWLCLLLCLCQSFMGGIESRDLPLYGRLRSAGVTAWGYMAGKLVLPFLLRLVLLSAAAWAASKLCAVDVGIAPLSAALAAAALVTVWETAVGMTPGGAAVPLSTIFAAAGLFLCGGLLPRTLLPKLLTDIGSLTPFGAVYGLLKPLFGGKCGFKELLTAALWTLTAACLISLRLKKSLKGGNKA